MMLKRLVVATSLLFALPLVAHADSAFTTGATTPLTASGHLDFQVTVPKFVYVRVSTGTNMAANATIDQIAFSVPAANVGDNTIISGTGGDLTLGVVTARVLGNNGAITFSSTTTGPLSNGSGDTIPYSQISTAVATNTSTPALAAPALASGSTTNVALVPNVGTKVTNLDAKWTFTYLNNAIVPPGTYGGINANGSRVTYTASMP
jgi:hypothetical protein